MWFRGIACNFYLSVDSVCSKSCARRFIEAGELKGICVFFSPKILDSSIHNEFWQGIIEITSIKCIIFTLPLHFIHSTIKVSKYYFVFLSLLFIFHINLQSFKEKFPSQLFPGTNYGNYALKGCALKGPKHREL